MSHADETLLLALEAQRGEALLNRDRAAMEKLFADDLVTVLITGIQQSKAEVIDYAMNTVQFLSISRQNLQLRFYGNDLAIMNGGMASTLYRSDNPQKILGATALVTQVWARTGSSWQQVSFHACRGAEQK